MEFSPRETWRALPCERHEAPIDREARARAHVAIPPCDTSNANFSSSVRFFLRCGLLASEMGNEAVTEAENIVRNSLDLIRSQRTPKGRIRTLFEEAERKWTKLFAVIPLAWYYADVSLMMSRYCEEDYGIHPELDHAVIITRIAAVLCDLDAPQRDMFIRLAPNMRRDVIGHIMMDPRKEVVYPWFNFVPFHTIDAMKEFIEEEFQRRHNERQH